MRVDDQLSFLAQLHRGSPAAEEKGGKEHVFLEEAEEPACSGALDGTLIS